jgi:hypothetical protein
MSIHDGYQTEHNHIHYLRKRITFSDAATSPSLGWVPFGATVIRGGVAVVTAFNGDATNTLDIGYQNGGNSETDDTNEFATVLALGTAGVIVADEMATAGQVYFPKGAEIVCNVVSTASPTAGVGYVWVEYLVDNDGDTSS